MKNDKNVPWIIRNEIPVFIACLMLTIVVVIATA